MSKLNLKGVLLYETVQAELANPFVRYKTHTDTLTNTSPYTLFTMITIPIQSSLLLLRAARLLPLLSNTASLMFSWDQHIFLHSFLWPPLTRSKADSNLPPYFKAFFPRGIVVIFTLYPLTLFSALANIYFLPSQALNKWYWAGLAFTFAHFLFAPPTQRLVKEIMHDTNKGNASKDMKVWLDWNMLRIWVADTPAWASFLMAALL